MRVINILLTGGLDSSYSIMYFSKFPVEIHPYYLKDHRKSEEYEIRAAKNIIEDIRKNKDTKAKVLDLETYPTYMIKPDRKISSAYRYMFRHAGFGKQYDFIARFAKQKGIKDFVVSLVYSPSGRGNMTVRRSKGLIRSDIDGMELYRLSKEKTEPHLYTIFKNCMFPVSFMRTKKQEIEEMKKLGFSSSIEKTWFCYWPIDGKPCGICNPCKDAIKEGMEWRFTKAALERNRRDKKVSPWKHQLRDYYLTITDKLYALSMRFGAFIKDPIGWRA